MTLHEGKLGGAVPVNIVKYLEITQPVVHKGSAHPRSHVLRCIEIDSTR